jgi:bifunctional enzyme CysN/CysC
MEPISQALEIDLRLHGRENPLRIIICGSVGEGMSSMIGHLLADTPTHEAYTSTDLLALRSTAGLAVVLLDARKGLPTPSRRHTLLLSLLGIRQLVVAVNKMDLVDHSETVFRRIETEFADFARRVGFDEVTVIPTAAVHGHNVVDRSDTMPWYEGATLRQHLERVAVDDASPEDVSATADAPTAADRFQATVVWTSEQPLLQGRSYLMKLGTKTVPATVAPIKYRLNVDTLEHVAARKLVVNDIGVCDLQLAQPVAFEPNPDNRERGGFILIDRITSVTVGAGVLHFALRRSQNVRWQDLDVDKSARAALAGHRPCAVWFTGLSGAGKSTIANALEKRLSGLGCHTYILDGDNIRHGLNKDLGFTDVDRVENIRRVAEVARLMVDAGLIVLVSFISPFRAERRMARELLGIGEFVEVFVDTPLDVAEARDPKGLYKKARRGELQNFTGIDSAYEPPENPEVHLHTTRLSAEEAAEAIFEELRRSNIVGARS